MPNIKILSLTNHIINDYTNHITYQLII